MYELTFAGHVSVQRPARPDVVLAVVPSLLAALVAQSKARRWNVPCVVWVQDLMGYAVAQSGLGGKLSSRLTQAAETSLVRRADSVVTIHDKFAQHMRDSGVDMDRAVLIRNWAHTETTIASKNAARRTFGWPHGDVVALHTGNMGLKQDLGNVVTAAKLARDASKGIRFVLVGDGSQRSHLESMSEGIENLTMLPPVHEGMYPELLAAADVLLVNERPSSVDMSLPSKLTSYCLAGQPIVAAVPNNGATAREVQSSGAGIVIQPGDPAGLLSAVERVAGDPVLRETLSAAGVSYATEHLDGDRAMDSFAELIDRLAQLPRV
jgi:glycosyltransferase involved in cell wall biosynthesis